MPVHFYRPKIYYVLKIIRVQCFSTQLLRLSEQPGDPKIIYWLSEKGIFLGQSADIPPN